MNRPVYLAPDGHGRYGILDYDQDGRVLCHECGRTWDHLATHLRGAHAITADAYRLTHGLAPGQALVGEGTRVRMAQRWAANADLHLADLAASRDTARARSSNRKGRVWTAQEIAVRQEANRARRGRDLTKAEVASLGDETNIPAWADAARALLALDGITATSIARVSNIALPTVHQRLRRYPGTGIALEDV